MKYNLNELFEKPVFNVPPLRFDEEYHKERALLVEFNGKLKYLSKGHSWDRFREIILN